MSNAHIYTHGSASGTRKRHQCCCRAARYAILTGLALIAPGVVLPAHGSQIAPPAAASQHTKLPADVLKAIKTGNYKAARGLLVIHLLKGGAITPENARALQYSMVLEWIRATGPDVLTTMAQDAQKRIFLTEFAQDTVWLELYLSCGLVPWQTDTGMDVLYRIWLEENGQVADKKLAVALASVWGGGETAPDPIIAKKDPSRYNPIWRYKFFRKQHLAGKLVPGYDNLRPWELRFVVGIAHQPWDDASFEYCAEHINMPPDQFGEAFKVVRYVGRSKFGETVHNNTMYYLPYPDMSTAEVTLRTGGVCGSQGHLGACAAMAHGVPAYTCGQPGHCAYGVRYRRGEWLDGNADFDTHEPSGTMHNYIFSEQSPTSTHLMETVFGDDATITKAYRQSFCAQALLAMGARKEAHAMWTAALKTSPFHAHFRRELHKLMRNMGLTPEGCRQYLMRTLPLYETHGFAAADMMEDLEDLVAKLPDKQKLEIFDLVHHMMSGSRYHDAVRCDGILARQDAMLTEEDSHEKLLTIAFTRHMSKGDGYPLGQFLEWAVANYLNKGKEAVFSSAFETALKNATGNEQQAGEVTKPLRKAYSKSILAIEKAHSVKAFQSITAAAVKAMGASKRAAKLTHEGTIPGVSIEGECLLLLSSNGYYDTPWHHGEIVSPRGGYGCTNGEKAPWATVEMPGKKELTGCIIRKANNAPQKATVAVSTDGVNWTTVAQTDKMPQEWAATFPEGTAGRFIRVTFDNGESSKDLQLTHFLVYRKK